MEPRSILVVDDMEICREPTVMMLAVVFHQAEIFQAEDGLSGWDLLIGRQFDLVITDYQMPKMDGLELTRKIKENFPWIRIIFASGYESQELAENALQAGASIFLKKPITLSAIQELVNRL